MDFNNRSRKLNAMLASSSGMIQQVVQILGNFVYRTIFLMFLSKEYLGINGLFSNVLQLFSLAELGIGSAILYSMYQPFAEKNTEKISALIQFYKKVYNALFVIVVVMGLAFYPFISTIVNVSEVPADVNLTAVYFLFVAQSAVSYLFVYKQSLLTADQHSHLISLFTSLLLLTDYGVRTLILFLTRNFVLVLLAGILWNLLLNWVFSLWITKKYKTLFQKKAALEKEDKRRIFVHTTGLLCHKIGYIVVTGTDNIILSKFVSLAAVGIYSNYATIIVAITNVVNRIVSSLVPTIANYVINKTKEASRQLFKRTLFINLWLSSFTTVCLFLLLNPFITLWLDESYLLAQTTVAWICLQHYLQSARLTANTFINSCGLFHLDKFRPLFESAINLLVSIFLAKYIGITGVFIGTCVSGILTYFWREPHILYKKFFGCGAGEYWLTQVLWLLITAALCYGGYLLFGLLDNTLLHFVLKVAIAAVVPNVILLCLTFHTDSCKFVLKTLLKRLPLGKKK